MKKIFLFAALTVLLAGFWFGGASLADGTGSIDCWKSEGATNCTGSDFGTYTVSISGNEITFSNLNLQYPNDGKDRGGRIGGRVGVKFIATGTNLHFNGISFGDVLDSTGINADGSIYGYAWFGVTSGSIIDSLSGESNEKVWTMTITGDNSLSMDFTIKIDLANVTLYSGGMNDNDIDFQVKNGKITVLNGKSTAWEIGCWMAQGANACTGSDYGTYTGTISTDKQTITFSDIKLQYPGSNSSDGTNQYRPYSGWAAFFGARIIASSLVNDTNSGSATRAIYTIADFGSNEKDSDGRIITYWRPNVTTGEIASLISGGENKKTVELAVAWTGIDSAKETLTVEIDLNNISLYSGSIEDENNLDFQVKNGIITKIDGEDAFTVTFDGANEQVIASGTNAQKPADPTKDCNSFDGWYNGDEKVTFPLTVTGNLALTSKWTYTCSRSSGGGGGSSRTTTTSKDDTKANTGDTAKTDEQKADENKTEEETVNEENKVEEKAPMTDAEAVAKYGQEQIDAYKWALENGITTMKTVEEARLDAPLTRAELAKMMVVYIAKILEKQPVLTGDVNYQDVKTEELGDLAGYIQLAYQYQIMGINADGTPIDFFNPNGLVTRGEYATVFSRVLFGSLFNKEGEDFYTDHIEALNKAGILSNTEPTIQEMRGWVMLMMYRSSQNAEKIAEVISTLGASEEEVADAQSKSEEEKVVEAPEAETTTGDVAEAPEAEASTGAVAE